MIITINFIVIFAFTDGADPMSSSLLSYIG